MHWDKLGSWDLDDDVPVLTEVVGDPKVPVLTEVVTENELLLLQGLPIAPEIPIKSVAPSILRTSEVHTDSNKTTIIVSACVSAFVSGAVMYFALNQRGIPEARWQQIEKSEPMLPKSVPAPEVPISWSGTSQVVVPPPRESIPPIEESVRLNEGANLMITKELATTVWVKTMVATVLKSPKKPVVSKIKEQSVTREQLEKIAQQAEQDLGISELKIVIEDQKKKGFIIRWSVNGKVSNMGFSTRNHPERLAPESMKKFANREYLYLLDVDIIETLAAKYGVASEKNASKDSLFRMRTSINSQGLTQVDLLDRGNHIVSFVLTSKTDISSLDSLFITNLNALKNWEGKVVTIKKAKTRRKK